MAKRTLLDLVQGVLSEIDGDEVNSISDTIESTSIAELVRQNYFDMIDEHDLPSNKDLISLTGLGDTNRPTTMLIPQNVSRIEWIKYDTRISVDDTNKNYQNIHYKTPKDFVTFVNQRPSTDTTNYLVSAFSANVPLILGTKQAPTYWTSFDDENIVFDSYNTVVDSTLQASKCICEAYIRPSFELVDGHVPDLPENLFGLLYAQTKAEAFANARERLNPKAERKEYRLRVRAQRNKWRESRMTHDWPDYGRRR